MGQTIRCSRNSQTCRMGKLQDEHNHVPVHEWRIANQVYRRVFPERECPVLPDVQLSKASNRRDGKRGRSIGVAKVYQNASGNGGKAAGFAEERGRHHQDHCEAAVQQQGGTWRPG